MERASLNIFGDTARHLLVVLRCLLRGEALMGRARYTRSPKEERMISFTVPGTPVSVNHYVKHRIIAGHIGSYKTRKSQGFARDLTIIAAGQQLRCKQGYEVEYIVFHGKGERGDVDNRAKVILDALVTAGVIDTDSKVMRMIAEKGRDAENPRTEITVRPYRAQLEAK